MAIGKVEIPSIKARMAVPPLLSPVYPIVTQEVPSADLTIGTAQGIVPEAVEAAMLQTSFIVTILHLAE